MKKGQLIDGVILREYVIYGIMKQRVLCSLATISVMV